MSPEISVATGWINTGYKYIIANGGNKSNNISINSISGSPTNDSNTRYTQDELKTSAPYKNFDFCNTWAIDRNSNSGYPYHYSNKYAINLDDQIIPAGFSFLYTNNYIKLSDLRQATDGFTLCVKPFGEILLDLGITDNKLNGDDYITLESLNNWYLFNKGNCYSILKMKTGHTDKGQIGTSIPFMEFNINLLELLYQDLSQQIQNSETEKQLYNELYCIIYNKIESGNVYSPDLAHYFNQKDFYPIVYAFINEQEKFSYISSKSTKQQLDFISTRNDERKNPVENDLYQGDVFYVSCIASKKQLESFYHDLKDRYQCLFSKDIYSQDWWLEILPKKATKAHAILQLKDYLKCEKVVVFGDGLNDLSMFEIADESYAVENACKELKEKATGVIGRHDQDAVARWLEENYKD